MRSDSQDEHLRFLSAVLEQARMGIIASDRERKVLIWSRGAEELLGLTPGEAVGRSMDELEHLLPVESRRAREEMKNVVAAGGTWEGELELRGSDGRKFTALVRNGPLHDGAGGLLGYIGLILDVSKRKRSEGELERRARQQAAVAALGRRALTSVDVNSLLDEAVRVVAETLDVELVKVLELSPDGDVFELRAGFGFSPDLVGTASVPADDSHAAFTIAQETVIAPDYEAETRFSPAELLRSHGARSGVTAVIEGSDNAYGVIGAHSKRSRSFSEDDAQFLQSVGNVLAAALSRQHAERLQRQLLQAQRLEAVGQLAGGIAHDFNNLLSVILNYAQYLLGETSDDDTIADLREIEGAAKRAAELTRQLLVFSRHDVDDPARVDLPAAVRQTETLLRRTIGEDIDLRVDAPDDVALTVELGLGYVDQILINLVVNSRDAVSNGGRVEVRVGEARMRAGAGPKPALAPGRYAFLEVADDGIGMAPEVAAQAFDPFFSTKPKDKGTGLGLATVYGIVTQAGGHVEIDSEEGRGTSIRVHLPLAEEAEQSEPTGHSPVRLMGRGETILVVEDEAAVRRMTCRTLEQSGYRVLPAADGAEALHLFEDHAEEVRLVLTDVVMPGLSGRELLETLRSRGAELSAVYMSGYAGNTVSLRGDLGPDVAFLPKPFTAGELLETIRGTLH